MTTVEMFDERSRALLQNFKGAKSFDSSDVLLGILHRLDQGTSERKTAYDRLLGLEREMKKLSSRGGSAGYLIAICIGVAATLAWQSYGEVPKQIIAAKAPELGWSPEAKQMIASWVQKFGLTKPPASPESTAASPSVPAQVATVEQTVPSTVVPKAPDGPSIAPEQVHQIAADVATLGKTVEQLAASQDQMVHQIDALQTSNQDILASNREILEKITAPPAPPSTAALITHKPANRTPPSPRAPTPRPYP